MSELLDHAATSDDRISRSGPAVLATMIGRSVRLSSRNIEALLTSLVLPVMIMLMFVYLFGGAISTGTAYVTYVVPGVMLLCVCFGSATTAVTVSTDLTGGIVDRFRSMDLGGASVLAGHVTASVLRNGASTAIVVAVAVAFGFRPQADPLHWVAAMGVLAVFVTALSWASAAIGVVAGSPEAANGFAFFAMFISYPSSAFVPIDTMPTWMQGFARHQPVTQVVESVRGILLGRPAGAYVWSAIAWSVGLTAVSVLASALLFRRRTR